MGWLALLILRKGQCEGLRPGIGAEEQTPTSFLFPDLNRILTLNLGVRRHKKTSNVMKQTKKSEELQSRREFFKSAAKGALPILGIMAFGPTLLTACEPDEDEPSSSSSSSSSGCGSCNGSCSGGCDATCRYKCSGGCKTGCFGVHSGSSGRL